MAASIGVGVNVDLNRLYRGCSLPDSLLVRYSILSFGINVVCGMDGMELE
jgi:hypothetical protein